MFGIPWISPTLLGAAGIAILASLSGAYIAHQLDAGPLAQAKAETSSIQSLYDGYKQSVATKAAEADAKAISEKSRLDGRVNALQAELAQTQKDADARSKALLAALAKAKPGDLRPIGPIAGQYYSQLRLAAPTSAPNHP